MTGFGRNKKGGEDFFRLKKGAKTFSDEFIPKPCLGTRKILTGPLLPKSGKSKIAKSHNSQYSHILSCENFSSLTGYDLGQNIFGL